METQQMLGYGIFALVGLTILGVIVYQIIRLFRGRIKIQLPRRGFNSNEVINGQIELKTRQAISGNRLFVALTGTCTEKYTDSDGKRRSKTRQVYHNECAIEGPNEYQAGNVKQYNFSIATPQTSSATDAIASQLGSMGTIATKALDIFMRNNRESRRYYKWKIEARLDAKGVDIYSRKKVHINHPDLL